MKKIIKIILGIIVAVVLIVIGYLLYVILTFYRLDDNLVIETTNNSNEQLKLDQSYTITTYNLGFGAYDQQYSFFMDCGVMLEDGEEVCGAYGKARSEESVINNTQGSISLMRDLESDFYFLQEVDLDSTRSFHLNQLEEVKNAFSNYGSVYAQNFHSAFLAWPLFDMHGSAKAGILTLSKYEITENVRRSFAIPEGFPAKYMDLDRCYLISRYTLENGKQLVLINQHMSAYDEGGLVRKQQLAQLNEQLKIEEEKGNYVIVGGDFNHDINNTISTFPTKQAQPEWVYQLNDEDLTNGYHIVYAENYADVATCRSADSPYEEGMNYLVNLDGFIISDNIEASAWNNDQDFMYSDHNSVTLTFKIKN